MFDRALLLEPVGESTPCGPPLRDHPAYDDLRKLATSPQQPEWGRLRSKAVTLAEASRDLRAWIWVTRASLCTEGLLGLANGLELIADGLERFWDLLPPLDAEEDDPRERFLGRLMALTELGVTNYRCKLDELVSSGRNLTDLRADLDKAIAAASEDASASAAIARVHAATQAITRTFVSRFGAQRDPQLGFEVVLGKLMALETKLDAGRVDAPPTAASAPAGKGQVLGGISSRHDVVRALELILEYYEGNEPSSPVPLLVRRAKRLVPLSFADAMKELAPGGLKELQVVTGVTDEKK